MGNRMPLTESRQGQIIRETDTQKIKLISFGWRGNVRTAQVVLKFEIPGIKRKFSRTFHLTNDVDKWLWSYVTIEKREVNGKEVPVIITITDEFRAECLPSAFKPKSGLQAVAA